MDSYQNGEGAKEAEFQRIAQNISSNVQKILQNVSSMQRMVRQLGTSQDCESLRCQLHQIQHYTNQLAKDTHRSCKDLDTLPPSCDATTQRQWKLQRERLTNDFTTALTNFQAAQRLAAERERDEVRRVRAQGTAQLLEENEAPGAPPARGGMAQTQAVMEEEERMKDLRSRETAVRQLESDIMDVNQIFRDLASMVHEQGEVIDSIEANVETAHGTVQQGVQQLGKASDYQNRARRKKMFCFIFLVVVMVIIIAIIVSNST